MVLPLFLKSVHSCFRKTSQSIDTIAVVIKMNKKKRSAMILTIATVSLCLVAWLSKPNTTNTIGSIVSGKTAVKEIYNVEKQNTIRKTLDEQIAQGSRLVQTHFPCILISQLHRGRKSATRSMWRMIRLRISHAH